MMLKLSDRFGDYEVIRFLGRGGMGEVYLMKHFLLGVVHAVKLLYQQKEGELQETQRRLLREARLAARVRHPNLVGIYDAGYEPRTGRPYIAMEYLGGGNLADRLKEHGRYTFAEAMEFLRPLAAALKALEKAGVAHCDIKPENIMFAECGTLKLSDFGVSRSVGSGDGRRWGFSAVERKTDSDMAFGTPAYMSPEQLTDASKIGPRSDIYSLGVVLYEMLAGQTPHEGDSLEAILARAMRLETLPDLRETVPGIPPCVARLVAEMTAPDIAKRPAAAAEVLALAEDAAIEIDPVLRKRRRLKRTGMWMLVACTAIAAVAHFTVPAAITRARHEKERKYWRMAANDTDAYEWLKWQPKGCEPMPCDIRAVFLCGFGMGPGDEPFLQNIVDIATSDIEHLKNYYYGKLSRFTENGTNLLANCNLVVPFNLPADNSTELFTEEDEDALLDWVASGRTLVMPIFFGYEGESLLAKAGLECRKELTGCGDDVMLYGVKSADAVKDMAPAGNMWSAALAHPLSVENNEWHPVYWHDAQGNPGAAICFRKWGRGTIIVAAMMVGPTSSLTKRSPMRLFLEKLLQYSLQPLPQSVGNYRDSLSRDNSDLQILMETGQVAPLSEEAPGKFVFVPTSGKYCEQCAAITPIVKQCVEAAAKFGLMPNEGEERALYQPAIVLRPVASCVHEYRIYFQSGGIIAYDNVFARGTLPLPICADWSNIDKCHETIIDGIVAFVADAISRKYNVREDNGAGCFENSIILGSLLKIKLYDAAGLEDLAFEAKIKVGKGGVNHRLSRRQDMPRSCHRIFSRLEKLHPGMTERFFPLFFRFCERQKGIEYKYTLKDIVGLLDEACGKKGASRIVLESEGWYIRTSPKEGDSE